MPKPFQKWTVLPHGKLTAIDDHILTVEGTMSMPLGEVTRRMTVVRLVDHSLVIFSAIALDEAEMQALEAFGTPRFLIVPSDRHRMDAKIWKDRYPAMKVIAPAGAKKKTSEVVHVDTTAIDFADPSVRFMTVPGTEYHEAALEVSGADGVTLVVNEMIFNLDDRPGFGGWVFHVLGMTGDEPKIPVPICFHDVKDKHALRGQLLAWAAIADLKRVIVSHGDIIDKEPRKALSKLAESLG